MKLERILMSYWHDGRQYGATLVYDGEECELELAAQCREDDAEFYTQTGNVTGRVVERVYVLVEGESVLNVLDLLISEYNKKFTYAVMNDREFGDYNPTTFPCIVEVNEGRLVVYKRRKTQ